MKTLGVLFIIAAIFLGIGAIQNSSPSDLERKQSESAEVAHSHNKTSESLNRLMTDLGGSAKPIDYRHADEMSSASERQRAEREQRLLFFAIPAGLLGITGLILVVSQRKPAGSHVPAQPPLHTTANSNPAPIASPSPPPPPKVGHGIYLHMRGEVAGPYTTSEVEGYLANGTVTLQTLCCVEGSEDWKPISDLAS